MSSRIGPVAICALGIICVAATQRLNAQDPGRLPPGLMPATADNTPKPAKPGDVILDQSRVFIFVGKTGFGHEHAVLSKLKSGAVVLGRKDRAGGFVFDMTSFDA